MVPKTGQNTGSNGGIFREFGPRRGLRDNFAATPDNRPLPPTTGPGAGCVRVKRTPDSHR